MNKLARWIAVIAITLAFLIPQGLANGVIVNVGTPTTNSFVYSQNTTILGGAYKNINATAETQTLAWQALFGNLTMNITLEDSSSNAIYKWMDATGGTVLVSNNSNVDFSNLTAQNNCSIDQSVTGTGSDRMNLTFTPSNNTEFVIGGTTITAGTACTTHTYVNSAAQSTYFEEIILQDGMSTIYATRVDTNTTGYDGQARDYQIIIPDYQNSDTITYYIYAEIE